MLAVHGIAWRSRVSPGSRRRAVLKGRNGFSAILYQLSGRSGPDPFDIDED
jgi:hypothetical protein